MCEYCEKERVLKSSNFCGAAKMQIIGEFLEVQGDSHKISGLTVFISQVL